MNIPIYTAVIIDEECGIQRISLVDAPAVESNFITLAKQKKPVLFKVQDEEKRLLRGVVMRADYPIYRRNENMGEYFLIFSPITIRTMAEKYLAESRQNLVNIMHQDNTDIEGVQMVQWFIKDTANGVDPSGFEDIEDGSLFAEFHILNEDIWNEVKAGSFKGFSLEGIFSYLPVKDDDNNDKTDNTMSKVEKMKRKLAEIAEKVMCGFSTITTDNGMIEWDGEEDLKQGDKVYSPATEEGGERTPLADGDYTTEDGKVIKVVNGEVAEIVDNEAQVSEEEAPQEEQTEMVEPTNEEKEEEEKPTEEQEQQETTPTEIDELRKEVNELYKLVDSILKRLDISRDEADKMRAEMEELKKRPSAKPASEEFEEVKPQHITDRKLSNAISIMSAKRK